MLSVLFMQAGGYGPEWRGDGGTRTSRRRRIAPGVFWLASFQGQAPLTVSRAMNVLRDRNRGPEQGGEGYQRDGKENTHGSLLRIPKDSAVPGYVEPRGDSAAKSFREVR